MAFASTAPNHPSLGLTNTHSDLDGPRWLSSGLQNGLVWRMTSSSEMVTIEVGGGNRCVSHPCLCGQAAAYRSHSTTSARSQSGSSSCRWHRPMKASTSRSPVSVAGRDPAKTDLNHSPVGSEVARWGRGCGGPGVGSAGGAPVGGRTADRAGRARQRGADTEPRAGVALLPIRCLDS